MSTWSERAANVFTPNYKPAPVVLARGDGVWLWDTEGRRYLDFAAGIAVCGIVVDAGVDRPAVRTRAMEKGLLMTQAGKDVLRFSPPLVCGRSHVEEAVEILSATLKELGNA